MSGKDNVFANPQAPSNYIHPTQSTSDTQHLTNDDFRKLLMTPSAGSRSERGPQTVRGGTSSSSSNTKKKFVDEASERRKEKKLFYASLSKEAKEREAELAQKYRDRAKERREKERAPDSQDVDSQATTTELAASTTANFRAVAPGFSLTDNAERRRQIIEESKYLGGDLEHTHLVKGLDYALLQKIRSEAESGGDGESSAGRKSERKAKRNEDNNNDDDDDEARGEDEETIRRKLAAGKVDDSDNDEAATSAAIGGASEYDTDKPIQFNLKPKILTKSSAAALTAALNKSHTDSSSFALKKQLDGGKTHAPFASVQKASASAAGAGALAKKPGAATDTVSQDDHDESKIVFKSKLSRSIYRVLFETTLPKHNELFMPHRMAYIVDLNDEETDVPITSIRSKAECPANLAANATLTTNDIVISKLTQILSYLRHGGKRDAKKLKKKLASDVVASAADGGGKKPIEASLGIYDDIGDYVPTLKSATSSSLKKETVTKKSYFGDKKTEEEPVVQAPSKEKASEFIKNITEKYAAKESGEKMEPAKKAEKSLGLGFKFDPDSYSECYPGTKAEEDVNIDSDEETDFSKMDLGSKKGLVNRWDFDTSEEYNQYMGNKEAMPRAAFQFGVKMADGRKTKRLPGDAAKTEKVKLDKEWNQISKIIDKRKTGDYGDYGKKPKY